MGNAHQFKGYPQQVLDAYLAGILDGEGCITIVKSKRSRTYNVWVIVSQKDARLCKFLRDMFGGTLRVYSRERIRGKIEQYWRWVVSGQQARQILIRCLPFLLLKKEQAEVALEFLETRYGKGRGRGKCRVSDEMVEYHKTLFLEIKRLKIVAETEHSDAEKRSDSPNYRDGKSIESTETFDRIIDF